MNHLEEKSYMANVDADELDSFEFEERDDLREFFEDDEASTNELM